MLNKINKYYLYDSSHRFPWHEIGLDRPKTGSVHSYLCSILANYVNPDWVNFAKGRPTFFELERAAQDSEDRTLQSIAKYCEGIYSLPKSERSDPDTEVLAYLKTHTEFNKMVDEILWRLYRRGSLKLPKEALYDGKSE